MKVDAASGGTSPLFDAGPMEAALASLPGVTRDEASEIARSSDLTFNPARTGSAGHDRRRPVLLLVLIAKAERLTTKQARRRSRPSARMGDCGVRARQQSVRRGHRDAPEQALTTDGNPRIFNGKLDWLYQEEIYGRGQFQGYWWSPDSSRLAFLQLDERPVPEYTVVDHIPYRPALEVTDYPKAGDPNPIVKLGVAPAPVAARVGRSRPVLGQRAPDRQRRLDSRFPQVVHQVQDREQTWLDLNLADVSNGRARKLLRETTPAWVNENGNPVWLKDGSFLWFSERSGFKHLYRYRCRGRHADTARSRADDGTCARFYGVDEAPASLYFASAERNPIGTDIYRIGLDGTGTDTALADRRHAIARSSVPTSTHYVDGGATSQRRRRCGCIAADGAEIRVIEANPVPALREYRCHTRNSCRSRHVTDS